MLKLLRQLIKRFFCKETADTKTTIEYIPVVVSPLIPPCLARCPWCHYYNNGNEVDNLLLNCAVHPSGPTETPCRDFKNRSQNPITEEPVTEEFFQTCYWELVGIWGKQQVLEAAAVVARTFGILENSAIVLIWYYVEMPSFHSLPYLVELVRSDRIILSNGRLRTRYAA